MLKYEHEQDAKIRQIRATYEVEMLKQEHEQDAEIREMKATYEAENSAEMKTMFFEMKVVMVATISLAVYYGIEILMTVRNLQKMLFLQTLENAFIFVTSSFLHLKTGGIYNYFTAYEW